MENRQHDANNGAQEWFGVGSSNHPTFDGKGVFMTAWHFARHRFALLGAGLLSVALSLPANAAIETQVVFFPVLGDNDNVVGSLLIDFVKPSRARVVSSASSGLATVAREAAQFVLTLDSPISQPFFTGEYDSCGGQPSLRKETRQFVVRGSAGNARRGVSKVVEIGTLTTLDGCDAGRIVPFGALTDAGVTMNWVAMNARPSIKDLLPGTQLAGLSEQPLLTGQYLPMDVVTLFAGNLASFATTGNVVPAAFNADEWLVFGFAGFERAYTRLAIDKSTGAERWLRAEWSGGEPQKVETDLVVKPDPSAGFGTVRQASRKWESGLFSQTMVPFFVYLYGNGTGERGTTDLATGTESRLPITWAFSGKNILQARLSPPNRRDRIWVPLRNHGAKIRFVMESESISLDGGLPQPLIPPRINFYIDTGRALNPTGLP